MDIITLALAKKHANMVALGISNVRVEGATIYFTIINTGEEVGVTLPTPTEGITITDIKLNENQELIFTLANNTIINAGPMKTIEGPVGPEGPQGP